VYHWSGWPGDAAWPSSAAGRCRSWRRNRAAGRSGDRRCRRLRCGRGTHAHLLPYLPAQYPGSPDGRPPPGL